MKDTIWDCSWNSQERSRFTSSSNQIQWSRSFLWVKLRFSLYSHKSILFEMMRTSHGSEYEIKWHVLLIPLRLRMVLTSPSVTRYGPLSANMKSSLDLMISSYLWANVWESECNHWSIQESRWWSCSLLNNSWEIISRAHENSGSQ